MKKKTVVKKVFVCIVAVLLIAAISYIIAMPNVNVVYEYNGSVYTQNSKSIIRHEIELPEYSEISNVAVADNGMYCHAKRCGNGYFLFVSKKNVITEIHEDKHYSSKIDNAVVCNGVYQASYSYCDFENGDEKTVLLKVDFKNRQLSYDKYPEKLSSYNYVTDGKNLFGSDGTSILKYSDGKYTALAKGTSAVGIYDNSLIFENDNELFQLDLSTNEVNKCDFNLNMNDYRTVDYESPVCFVKNYCIGCKVGFSKYSGGNSLFTHTSIQSLNHKVSFILLGSTGSVYENIQIMQ